MSKFKDFSFEIYKSKWNVKFCDKIKMETDDEDSFHFGLSSRAEKLISIAVKGRQGETLDDREIKSTLLHEMIHAILGEGQYLTPNDDEPLVEWLAKTILDLNEQGVFKRL